MFRTPMPKPGGTQGNVMLNDQHQWAGVSPDHPLPKTGSNGLPCLLRKNLMVYELRLFCLASQN